MNRSEAKDRLKDFYQLKANLVDVQLEKDSTRLILTFEKRSDPMYSAERLGQLSGFVVCSFKKVRDKGPTLNSQTKDSTNFQLPSRSLTEWAPVRTSIQRENNRT